VIEFSSTAARAYLKGLERASEITEQQTQLCAYNQPYCNETAGAMGRIVQIKLGEEMIAFHSEWEKRHGQKLGE